MGPGDAAWCAERYPLVFQAWTDALRGEAGGQRKAALMDRLKGKLGMQ